jgi:hypothetical protein
VGGGVAIEWGEERRRGRGRRGEGRGRGEAEIIIRQTKCSQILPHNEPQSSDPELFRADSF